MGLGVAGQLFFCAPNIVVARLAQVELAIQSKQNLQMDALTFSICGVHASFLQ